MSVWSVKLRMYFPKEQVAPAKRMAWHHFEHGADIGVCGTGPTLAVAFEEAATAMTAVMVNPEKVAAREMVTIDCTAPNPELLLVDWLNALVLETATRGLLFGRYEVTTDGETLRAVAWGEPIDVDRHAPAVEVKGATYTELFVGQDSAGSWTARCVVDV